MAIGTAKISAGDRRVTRPARYWPIVLIATAMAESAQAPLHGKLPRDVLSEGPAARAAATAIASDSPRGVDGPRNYKPSVFETKNRPSDPVRRPVEKKKLQSEPLAESPVLPDLASAVPVDPLPVPAEPTGPADITDDVSTGSFSGGAALDPLPGAPPEFAVANPFIGDVGASTGPQTVNIESSIAAVPEPGVGLTMMFSTMLGRRRRRRSLSTSASPSGHDRHVPEHESDQPECPERRCSKANE
jgi:hypothetical protein